MKLLQQLVDSSDIPIQTKILKSSFGEIFFVG